jgi:D-3-phosphoglycerate dehydrogenase
VKILLTSTSFQDSPGSHQTLLDAQGFELVKLRGPLKEAVMLDVIEGFDGIVCGDDEITRAVIEKGAKSRLRIISKYGIGLDKIDVTAAKEARIPVTNCPGVNNVTVAEHVFALLLSYSKNIIAEHNYIQAQNWKRLIGTELFDKTIGIVGLGNIGKEVAKRAIAFGLKVIVYDKFIDQTFAASHPIQVAARIDELLRASDIITLHVSLNPGTRDLVNPENIGLCKPGVIVINTARAGLISNELIMQAIESKKFGAYLTDVLEEEPMVKDHPFLKYENIIITPHIGSRTYESVVRQGTMAVENLLQYINQSK